MPSCRILKRGLAVPVSVPRRRLPVVSAFFLLFFLILLQGCRYPQDVQGTLAKVRGGVLDVGVTENPPWVIRSEGGGAQGLEPELIRRLADQLNAKVRWHWGPESQLLQALQQFQLDIVIAGIASNKWVGLAAAPTKPYVSIRFVVGFPQAEAVPESLEGLTVGVMAVNHLAKALLDRGANPEQHSEPLEPEGAFAGPVWWLEAHGYQPGPFELTTDKHVMLLPRGENAWMMAVQKHLNNSTGIEGRLQQLEAGL